MKLNALIATILPAAALAAVFIEPTGPYKVQWSSSELIDRDRPDPFNTSHPRRMMISRFSPVPACDCKRTCCVPYMSASMGSFEEAILNAFLFPVSWPDGVLASLEMDVCCEVRDEEQTRKHPTLILSTGLNTTRLFYSVTAQHLASIGYEIIVMDHPYETDVVEFPNGDIIFGGRIAADPNNITGLVFGLDARTADLSFVLDTLGVRRTSFIGQSFGGAAAATAMLTEPRVLSGANLDGAMWGPAVQEGVSRPFLIWGSDGHNSSTEATWAQFFSAMDSRHSGVWTRELSLVNSSHGSFLDSSLVGDITGLRDNQALVDDVFGAVSGARVMEVLKAYLGDFVKFTLGHTDEGLLAGPSEEFPDVLFLR